MEGPGGEEAPAWGEAAYEATGGLLGGDGRFRVAGGAEGLRLSAAEAAAVEALKAAAAAAACGEAGGPGARATARALAVCEGLVLLCAHLEVEVAGAALDSAGATGEMCASLLAYDAPPGRHKPHAGEACYAPGLLAAAARRARFEPGRRVFHPRGFPRGGPGPSGGLGAWEPHGPEPDWPARLVRLMAAGLVEEHPEPGGPEVGTEARLEVVAWALRLAPEPLRAILALASAAARPLSLLYSREPLPLGYEALVELLFGQEFDLRFLREALLAIFADALARGSPAPERLAAREGVLARALGKKEGR